MASVSESRLSWRFDPVSPAYLSQIKEIWRFRELFPALFWRSLRLVREKAVLGIGWTALNSLVMVLPFAFIIWQFFNVDTGALPPAVFLLSGFSAWMLFRQSSQFMMRSLSMHRSLMKRFSIPPLLLVMSMASVGLFAFMIATIVLLASLVYYWLTIGSFLISFGWNLVVIVIVIALHLVLALGISCLTSIFAYVIADTIQVMRYVFMAWLIASPILYSLEAIDPTHRIWFYLNPMTGLIELYRWSLFGVGSLDWFGIGISLGMVGLILLAGLAFFLKFQRRILDFS